MRSLNLVWVALAVVVTSCSSAPKPSPVAFAESAAYRKLKSDIVAFHEVDTDGNGFPDGLIFSKTADGFVPILYAQEPRAETTQWVRQCKGEPLRGERLERLRPVRDGQEQRLLATATIEDPDRLEIEFAVFDPQSPCEPILRGRERFEKPQGDVLSPGPVRLGLQTNDGGDLVIVDSPATTRLRGLDGSLEVLTALTVRRWQGSEAPAGGEWRTIRKSLLKKVDVAVEFQGDRAPAPDAIVGTRVTASTINGAEPTGPGGAAMTRGSWVMPAGEAGVLTVASSEPFVVLEVRHGCALGEISTLEMSSLDGPSLFVTGGKPVLNGVFMGSASGRQKPGRASVELGALPEPTTSIGLLLGPIEKERCIRGITAYGWTVALDSP